MTQQPAERSRAIPYAAWAAFAVAAAALLWAFWPTLGEMAERWAHDPQYSHGFLVPAFACFLLWVRRGLLRKDELTLSWLGLPVLAAAVAMRLVGAYYYYVYVDAIALVPCVLGLVLTFGGKAAFRWAWPAVLFLAFMVPLPYRASTALAEPLQHFATETSTFFLQTLGTPAVSEGNVILLNDVEIGVVEACSGLRMLVIFFALSTAVALIIRRPLWEKLVVVVSAIPIALVVNVLRITVTGALHELASVGTVITHEMANTIFHDLAGWLMMPVALAAMALELLLLKRLFLEAAARPGPAPLVAGYRPAPALATPAAAAPLLVTGSPARAGRTRAAFRAAGRPPGQA
jgi:exosortase